MQKLFLLVIALIFNAAFLTAQNNSKLQNSIDIQKYAYHISVNDTTDIIEVTAEVNILFNKPLADFSLDLVSKDADGKGMTVDQVFEGEIQKTFNHGEDRLTIIDNISNSFLKKTYTIKYHGIPKDGLIIGKNKFGDRTFFGDNWPNRAHNWLVCVDHPSDKAFVEFYVTAPNHYQVISNGILKERTNINDRQILSVWKTSVPLPTKVMVIGVARFAVENVGEIHQIPISTWVYPQNKKEGFYDYAPAKEITGYYMDHIGPFSFGKLANVQSKTRFGGMENASCIFYFERSVTGQRKHESLIVHEIAHQWFGDSATETSWKHLWLSEGFATYFTNLYFENKYGKEVFKKRLSDQRKKVIRFSKNHKTAVIDTVTTNLIRLLNANSYEKGSWVLHMLRRKVGDDLFWEGIRKYYKEYALKNASTNDLKKVFEQISGQNLEQFFEQWLEKPGHPILNTSYVQNDNIIMIKIQQTQKDFPLFSFPLEIEVIYNDRSSEKIRIRVTQQNEVFSVKIKSLVSKIIIDPDIWLLYETAE